MQLNILEKTHSTVLLIIVISMIVLFFIILSIIITTKFSLYKIDLIKAKVLTQPNLFLFYDLCIESIMN